MNLISSEAVTDLILGNKAKHCSERIDADDVCDWERMKRIESRMDEDDDIGNKVSELPSAFEGMTNGEVIRAMFPNISVYQHGSTYSVNNEYNFNSTWWNAPYQKGGK